MYFKKTFKPRGIYIIGKLIKPMREGKNPSKSQDWLVKVYVDHKYMDCNSDNATIVIPTGDENRHEVKIYKDYGELLASIL